MNTKEQLAGVPLGPSGSASWRGNETETAQVDYGAWGALRPQFQFLFSLRSPASPAAPPPRWALTSANFSRLTAVFRQSGAELCGAEQSAGEAGGRGERSRRHDGRAAAEFARLLRLCQEDPGPYLHPELHDPLV